MRCALQLKEAFECSVCRQDMLSEEARRTRAIGCMVGAVDFGICPACGQEVDDFKESGYRVRARKYVSQLKEA